MDAMASCFAFLPHVRVQSGQEIRVGKFIVWGNSAAEWLKRFGADNTAFFKIYRDQQGNPVGEKASILSRPDYTEAPYEEFRDAVYCLSSAVWVRGPGASDAWVFERWLVDVPTQADERYRRESKFSVHVTSAQHDRVYPTPYTHPIDLNPYHDQRVIDCFAKEMAKPREQSMLTAFSHFHLSRFDTPYFTSPGDAIESMWSGFESLLEIDNFGSTSNGDKEDGGHVGKDEKLLRALRAEFAKYPAEWRPELLDGVAAWTKQFYKERNHHSHGVRGDLAIEKVEPYGLSAFSVAVHVARAALRLRWLGDNFFIAQSTAEELNSLFLFAPVVKHAADILRHHDRKVWYPGTGNEGAKLTADMLSAFERDLIDLVNLRLESHQFRADGHVAQARQKMGLVLSHWVTDLLKHPPPNVNLAAVSQIPSTIKAFVEEGKPVEEIDTELAEALISYEAANVDTYGPGARAEPRLFVRDRIPIWLWIDALIRLTEIWLGYQLR
jgi:hypothetical protein